MALINNSQRLILALLLEHHGSTSRIRLANELFLLSSQNLEKKFTFTYDFFPYKFGPYSIEAFRDVAKLSEQGFLFDTDPVELLADRQQDALQETRELPLQIKHTLVQIANSYAGSSDGALIDDVYGRYPEYMVLSELKHEPRARERAKPAIYTVGYAGTSLDGFLNMLIQRGIHRVIDVRFSPNSRNWGFSQKMFSQWCRSTQIEYMHLPGLGVPGELRKNLNSIEDVQRLLLTYEQTILAEASDDLERLGTLLEQTPSVLMCLERDPKTCHRSVLAMTLHGMTELPVIDLR
jgi:uncharacterized protein (DUF488 family)